jgi:nucleotide-binding universal stress UspA family protein
VTVRHVLVATDGSDNATEAVRWAADIAAATGAAVTVVHVFEPLSRLHGQHGPVDLADLRAAAEQDLRGEWSESLRRAGVTFETVVVEGRPAPSIAEVAGECGADLVVIGARGMSTLRGLVVGSTSMQLPHLVHVPVTIVPPPAPPPSSR